MQRKPPQIKSRNRPIKIRLFDFDKDAKAIQWREDVSPINGIGTIDHRYSHK